MPPGGRLRTGSSAPICAGAGLVGLSREEGAVVAHAARNRFSGVVSHVVAAPRWLRCRSRRGPHRFASLLSRESAGALALESGMLAVAAVSHQLFRRDPGIS
jgi:hypothetical protein